MNPETCPNCGAEVPERARSCPHCGADEATGWNERATEQRLGVADPDDFDADEYARNEADEPGRRGLAWYWVVAAGLLLLAFLWWAIP
jgi:RNA polymerase subunit RPABC4/transcription elongation factor Spt4